MLLQVKLPMAAIGTAEKSFVKPTMQTISKAAANAQIFDGLITINKEIGKDYYPISALSYMMIMKEQAYSGRTKTVARDLLRTLSWMLKQGQINAPGLYYAPLPDCVILAADSLLKEVIYESLPIMEESLEP